MAFNSVAFKKSMLSWDAVAKRSPADIAQAVRNMVGADPEAERHVSAWSKQVTTLNLKLRDLLDRVVVAKDDKARADAAKNALNHVKQYQSFVASSHLPAEVQTRLKNGPGELAKGLGS